jgi:hypothetical protein
VRVVVTHLLPVLGLALCACASRPVTSTDPFERGMARGEVVAAVLRQLYTSDRVERFVIDPIAQATDAWGRERLPRLAPSTLRDFVARRAGRRLPDPLDAGRPVVWFTDADWNALPLPPDVGGGVLALEERWTSFRRAQPGSAGMMSFSEVGFSSDGRQALVHVWTASAGLSGYGQLILLEREALGWQVVDKTTTVVS